MHQDHVLRMFFVIFSFLIARDTDGRYALKTENLRSFVQ